MIEERMKILAIETSCDETGVALLQVKSSGAKGGAGASSTPPRFTVLKSFIASQIKVHQPFGGVVPNLAKREHLKNLPLLYRKLAGNKKSEARFWRTIDLIAVTVGPGLEPALWTGIGFAKELAKQWRKPLVGANHLEGHLYSFLLPPQKTLTTTEAKNIFPAVALIVSGGHTILLHMTSFTKWRRLGETRDDAAGEAFDKVARLLDLAYPGGPEIETLAKKYSRARENRAHPYGTIPFPRPMLHPAPDDPSAKYDFSFSGLKTAVLYYLRDGAQTGKAGKAIAAATKADVAASFQEAAIEVLVTKTIRAAREYGARSVILCGGVAANKALRARLARASKKIGCRFFVPAFKYNMDNAAMIGAAGYMARARKKKYSLAARGNLEI